MSIKLSIFADGTKQDVYTPISGESVSDALGYTPANADDKGANNGIAELDSAGKVPSSQLPSYVDDVIEGYYYNGTFYKESAHTTSITPETGKIYIDIPSNTSYRWGGSVYVEISQSITVDTVLNENSNNAIANSAVTSAINTILEALATKLVITTDANATVKATKGAKEVTGTADESGNCTLTLPLDLGVWTVSTSNGTVTNTTTVNVLSVNTSYNVTVKLSSITLTGDVGNTVTATKDNITVTGTVGSGGTCKLVVSTGTWTVESANSDVSVETTVNVANNGTDYPISMTLPTITFTSNTGNTITATDGTDTVTGNVVNGTCVLKVGVGTWNVTSSNGTLSVSDTVTVSAHSTNTNKTLKFATITVTGDAGNTLSATDGTHTVTGTVAAGGTGVLNVSVGSWTVTTTDGTVSATGTAVNVAAHSSNYNTTLTLPTITLTGDVGNSVTATKGSATVSGTVASGGTCVLKVETGTWTVKSAKSGNANVYVTDSVVVSANNTNYPLSMTLPTITVTTSAGATCTATKSGVSVSGTADSNGTCVLKVAVGTWSVSATDGSNTETGSVTLSAHSTNQNITLSLMTAWQILQSKVRAGTAASEYPVGSTITVKKNNADTTWVVAAHDKATPADSTKTHSMTLIPQNCIESLRFDAAEPNNPNSDRKSYGNNRYAHSAIRQWLNSSADAGSWWTSQHTYDAAPDYATTKDGFMKGFDPDFLAVLGKTSIIVAKNTVTDGGGSETLSDEYFYLMSKMEVGLGAENSINEGQQFPIFTDANSRKRTYNGSSTYWWLRSPRSSYSRSARGVFTDGSESSDGAYYAKGILPACNII